jgi:hypothetical protein
MKRNEVLEELKVDPVENKLAYYKQKWLNNINKRTVTAQSV